MRGIAVCGTLLVDKILQTESYPNCGELTSVKSVSRAAGGLVHNVGADIKIMRPDIPVYAYAKIGCDDDGKFVLNELEKRGVNVSGVSVNQEIPTGFTSVISVKGGQRTFFTYNGANDLFGFNGDWLFCEQNGGAKAGEPEIAMLHLGYFGILKAADEGEGLAVLKSACKQGVKTSIDMVSFAQSDFSCVKPCLKYTHNLIINEVEASLLTGIEVESLSDLKPAAIALKEAGVRERVIIHMPEAAVCLSGGGYTVVPSLEIEKSKIVGTTGAGDAFCAACLVGIYDGLSDEEMLEFASEAAACSLFAADAVSGLTQQKALREQFKNYKRKNLC